MDEIWSLLEEHAAVRWMAGTLMVAVRPATGSPDEPARVATLLARLQRLLEVHRPKDDALVIPRLLEKGVVTTEELSAFQSEREVVDEMLRAALHCAGSEGGHACHPLAMMVDALVVAVEAMLLNEEAFLYPLLCQACDDDEKWRLSVELDRAVDVAGRAERSALLAA
ncbi:MAG: hemerythrin domain-containing protein [Myxococcota bacterium]